MANLNLSMDNLNLSMANFNLRMAKFRWCNSSKSLTMSAPSLLVRCVISVVEPLQSSSALGLQGCKALDATNFTVKPTARSQSVILRFTMDATLEVGDTMQSGKQHRLSSLSIAA
jgi:hypothetical protein